MDISSKSTVKELRKFISQITARINITIREYRESGKKIPKAYEENIKRLQRISGVKKPLRGEIGVGTAYKRKKELLRQAGALKSFEKFDVYSPAYMREQNKKSKTAYQTFKRNYGSISYKDWQRLVDIYGTLDSAIVSMYGSDQIKELVQDNVDETITANDIQRILLDTYKDNLDKGYTSEDLLNIAVENIEELRSGRK